MRLPSGVVLELDFRTHYGCVYRFLVPTGRLKLSFCHSRRVGLTSMAGDCGTTGKSQRFAGLFRLPISSI